FNVDAINKLKLRASYGTVGNRTGLSRYGWQNNVGFASYPHQSTPGDGSTATETTTTDPLAVLIGNPDLKWETTHSLNVGLELNMFNNRVRAVADYFKRNTEDLLFTVPSSHESGTYFIPDNIGEIENKGIELSLQGDIVRNNNFTWTLGGNVLLLDHK